jgi:hypothetical protein
MYRSMQAIEIDRTFYRRDIATTPPYNPLLNTPASFFNHLSAHKYITVHPLLKFIPPVFIFYLVWGLKLGVVISRGGRK